MRGFRFLIAVVSITLFTFCVKQTFAIKAPFNKGVNLTGWFQVDNPKRIQFSKYTRTDFEQIKSLGCDAVRLPINLHFMTNGAPEYIIDPLFYTLLDQVVGWCEELDIHLILDNHTFDVTKDTDPLVGTILEKVWTQMATHYLNTSTLIYFEVLNEPHGIEDSSWNVIQQKTVAAIRTVDTKHTIVVGGANWNSYHNLDAISVYSDTNLIYTFHFYDPFLFTHQGSGWTILSPARNIPFPYSEEKMPALPFDLIGTWAEGSYSEYKNVGNEEKVREWIDIAANFSESRNVPVWCGEFGVYDVNCPYDDRTYWYGVVRKYLEEKEISWTIWDYQGAFGFFAKGSNQLFDHDLNIPLLTELGLNIPEQTPFSIKPDEEGFSIYNDFFGKNISDGSYGAGTFDFYSAEAPQSGSYCFSWHGGIRYDALVLNFNPDRDLSYLSKNGYALALMVKGDDPNGEFDIRFLDSNTSDPNDHPWRIKRSINKNMVKWDNKWHKLYLPLSSFTEQGSWDPDGSAWFNPEGKFDWKAVDRFDIALESKGMGSYSLWFDNISITNKDTLKEEGEITINNLSNVIVDFVSLQSSYSNQIRVKSNSGNINYKLLNLTGKVIAMGAFENEITINSNLLVPGIYFIHFENEKHQQITKKVLIN
jgi:endoglucanase